MTTIESLIKEASASKLPETQEQGDFTKIAQALNSASRASYTPEVYEATRGIMKIAASAFDSLMEKVSSLEKISAVREVVDEMLDRGIISKIDVSEKTAELMKKNEHELEVVKEAIKLASMNNGYSLGSLDDNNVSGYKKSIFEGVI